MSRMKLFDRLITPFSIVIPMNCVNLIWSFYHYVSWYGLVKGISLWLREWLTEGEG